jgi:transcriptional regulator with GAF, ATPase, and Fis domain
MALEEGMLRRALVKEGGVQARAADFLGLKRNLFKYQWDKFIGSAPNPMSEEIESYVPQEAKLSESLDLLEETMLHAALKKSQGKQTQAASDLGIKRNLLIYKVQKYPSLKKLLND